MLPLTPVIVVVESFLVVGDTDVATLVVLPVISEAALRYFVVAFPIPVATVTSPEEPVERVVDGCVTENVASEPITVSVPVSPIVVPLALAEILVVSTLCIYCCLPVAVADSADNAIVGSVTELMPVATCTLPVPLELSVANVIVG